MAVPASSFSFSTHTMGSGTSAAQAYQALWHERMPGRAEVRFSEATIAKVRGSVHATRSADALIMRYHLASGMRTAGPLPLQQAQVRLFVLNHGELTLAGTRARADQRVVPGMFHLEYSALQSDLEGKPGVGGYWLCLPAEAFQQRHLRKPIHGSSRSAEMRILMAHVAMIEQAQEGLSAAGVLASRNALVQLATGLVRGYVDGGETVLDPALVRAARRLADAWLQDPDVSPDVVARELHVSVRTLQRAFSTTGESPAAYIRRRRLEAASQDLIAGMTVSDVAARWHFTDSSHFIRAFRRQYHRTPRDFAQYHQKKP